MQNGFLTIVTAVDGVESRISCKAEMELGPLSAVLRYSDENATVEMHINGNAVGIKRNGDYSMHLLLEEGKRTKGAIAIAGNIGDLVAETERVAYTIGKNSILMQLHYALIFGEEKQDMRIRLSATQNPSEER